MIFKENKGIYLQIASRIADEIVKGAYTEGERIPAVREYAAAMEVNVNTVMRSYDYLQQEGVLFNRRGVGYFVAEGACRAIKCRRREEFVGQTLPELFQTMDTLGIGIDELAELYRKHKN